MVRRAARAQGAQRRTGSDDRDEGDESGKVERLRYARAGYTRP